MADRPEYFPEWAKEDEIDPVSGQNNVVEPPEERKASGWTRREIPPRQWQNWLSRFVWQWLAWARDKIDDLGPRVTANEAELDAATRDETPDTIAKRDANGRMRAEDPEAAQDVATKNWTQNNTGNPGYAIYYTDTTQTHHGGGNVEFDSEADSYNVNDRISANSGLTEFTLQPGYYRIGYLGYFIQLESSPAVTAQVYDITSSADIEYTTSLAEIDESAEECTLSFSFPIRIDQEKTISLRVNTEEESGQRGVLKRATLSIEAVR